MRLISCTSHFVAFYNPLLWSFIAVDCFKRKKAYLNTTNRLDNCNQTDAGLVFQNNRNLKGKSSFHFIITPTKREKFTFNKKDKYI